MPRRQRGSQAQVDASSSGISSSSGDQRSSKKEGKGQGTFSFVSLLTSTELGIIVVLSFVINLYVFNLYVDKLVWIISGAPWAPPPCPPYPDTPNQRESALASLCRLSEGTLQARDFRQEMSSLSFNIPTQLDMLLDESVQVFVEDFGDYIEKNAQNTSEKAPVQVLPKRNPKHKREDRNWHVVIDPLPADPHVSNLIVTNPSLELSMRLATIRSVQDLDEEFGDHQYEFDVQASAEALYKWQTPPTLDDYSSNSNLYFDKSLTGPQPSYYMPPATSSLPPFHHHPYDVSSEAEFNKQWKTSSHAHMTLCISCSSGMLSPDDFSTKLDYRVHTGVGEAAGKTKKTSKSSNKTKTTLTPGSFPRLSYYWRGEETRFPVSSEVVVVYNEDGETRSEKKNVLFLNVSSLSLSPHSRDAPGGEALGGFRAVPSPTEDSITYKYHNAKVPLPTGTPQVHLWDLDDHHHFATIKLSTNNFYAGVNGGRLQLILDESHTAIVVAEEATIKLSGLSQGYHNLTVHLYTRPLSTNPFFMSDYLHFYVAGNEKDVELQATELIATKRNDDKPLIEPVLEIVSPLADSGIVYSWIGVDCSVDFLFDFKCHDTNSMCGQKWPRQEFNVDLYLDDELVKSKIVFPGQFSSIPLPRGRMTTGTHTATILATQDVFAAGALPIAGASSTFSFHNISEHSLVMQPEVLLRSTTSQDPIDRLGSVQRALNENTRHNFVTKGMHVFSPESGANIEERFTVGGGALNIFFDIPFLNAKETDGNKLLQVPRDCTIEMILSVPESSTCSDKVHRKSRGIKRIGGPAKGVEKDTCGGYHGEISLPLESPRGRVKLRNVGNGLHTVRFRILDSQGSPILTHPSMKESKFVDTLASVSFTFNNHTLLNIRDDMPWENTELTTELWNIVQSGTVNDLETLQARNPLAIHSRSQDGRGILWWAYEYGREDIIEFCIDQGIDQEAKDKEGFIASQLQELFNGGRK